MAKVHPDASPPGPSGDEAAIPPRATEISAVSRGKKIVIMTHGTRGDVQPFIALASHLQSSGFHVLVLTNVNHVPMVERFGLAAKGLRYNIEEAMTTDGARQGMAEGDFLKVMASCGAAEFQWYNEGGIEKQFNAIKDFGPDLIITTPLEAGTALVYTHLLKLPLIGAALQHRWPTSTLPTMLNEPRFHKWVAKKIMKESWKGTKGGLPYFEAKLKEEFAKTDEWVELATFKNYTLDFMSPVEPQLLAMSEHFSPRPKDWPRSLNVIMSGFWVVSRREQEKRMERQDSKFGGQSLLAIHDFLAKGDPPVYMGWGSMTAGSPTWMTGLAVRSLKRARLRGVILGGWAGLSSSLVEDEPDAAELKPFIEEKVLFLDSAPHEWLFPQCAVTVHHGGAGTMAAALRSGVPTVITPIIVDQFANATLVQRSGCGLALKQFNKVTEQDLGAAIARCVADKTMRAKAAALGQRLQEEDGVDIATKAIDRFIRDEVVPGNWARNKEARMRKHELIAGKKKCCGR